MKLNLHEILFQSMLALSLHSKQISWLDFSCFKLFIFPSNVRRPHFFRAFTPLHPHQGSAMNSLQSLQHLVSSTSISQHSKTQSLFKTDTSKTVWINGWIGRKESTSDRKIPGSNLNEHSTRLSDPTLLRGSWWPSGRIK